MAHAPNSVDPFGFDSSALAAARMGGVCTLSWFDAPDGYHLFFNRDERRTRRAEIPPAVRCRGSVRFIAPLDGDFGGTWIAANESGLTLCLLNGFGDSDGDERADRSAILKRNSDPYSVSIIVKVKKFGLSDFFQINLGSSPGPKTSEGAEGGSTTALTAAPTSARPGLVR